MPHLALTEYMTRTVASIRAAGGSATPEGGGWWKGADGKRLDYDNVRYPGTRYPVQTLTIYALVDRGILKRTGKAPERWRDTYVLSD